jgi:hypothetical protein
MEGTLMNADTALAIFAAILIVAIIIELRSR